MKYIALSENVKKELFSDFRLYTAWRLKYGTYDSDIDPTFNKDWVDRQVEKEEKNLKELSDQLTTLKASWNKWRDETIESNRIRITLTQALEAADRASEQVASWPKWKQDLSNPEKKEDKPRNFVNLGWDSDKCEFVWEEIKKEESEEQLPKLKLKSLQRRGEKMRKETKTEENMMEQQKAMAMKRYSVTVDGPDGDGEPEEYFDSLHDAISFALKLSKESNESSFIVDEKKEKVVLATHAETKWVLLPGDGL